MGNESKTQAEDTADLNLGKSSLTGFLGKISLALIGFAGLVFFYRSLGPLDFGIYYTVLSSGKFISSLQSGITGAIRKRVSEVDANQSEYLGLGVILILTVLILGIAFILLSVVNEQYIIYISEQFGIEKSINRILSNIEYLFSAVAVAVSLATFGLSNQFYSGIGNPGKSIWMDTLRTILTIGSQTLLILVGFNEFGLISGFILGTVTTAVVLIYPVGVRPTIPSIDTISQTFSYAKWNVPSSILASFYARFDVILITTVVGASASGVYAPAIQLTNPATFVASSIAASLAIKSSGASSQNKSVRKDLRNAFSYSGLIAMPMFFGSLAIPNALMEVIFGPSAKEASIPLIILALYHLFKSYIAPLNSTIGGIDRPDMILLSYISCILINIPIALLLIQSYGIIGVVSATAIAEGSRLLITYIIVSRLKISPGIPPEVIKQIIASVVMFGVVETISAEWLIMPTDVIKLLIVIAIGAVIYFLTLTIISYKFRNTAQKIVGDVASDIG